MVLNAIEDTIVEPTYNEAIINSEYGYAKNCKKIINWVVRFTG